VQARAELASDERPPRTRLALDKRLPPSSATRLSL